MSKKVKGLYAAMRTPRHAGGDLDERAVRDDLQFLASRGLPRVVMNGATGECCRTDEGEFARLVTLCRESLGSRGEFLCGIGAPDFHGTIRRGRLAIDGGATALLLSMPYFFPYRQEDLAAFATAVADQLEAPILLYNLPRFTSPLQAETVQTLLGTRDNLIGIKDSSGSLDILRALTSTHPDTACRIVGDDSALAAAMREQVCDGAISGVASVLPELLDCAYRGYDPAIRALDAFLEKLSIFPVPWGLKWVASFRGLPATDFPLPVSEERRAQARELEAWFTDWWPQVEAELLAMTPLD